MISQTCKNDLPESRRREIFFVLVGGQDLQMSVAESRQMVCERFDVDESLVRLIEREGLDHQWPPL